MGRIYDTARWRSLRRQVIARDMHCQHPECTESITDVDHVDGDTENNSLANLRGLCHAHHSQKTARNDRAHASSKPYPGHDANGLPTDRRHPWG